MGSRSGRQPTESKRSRLLRRGSLVARGRRLAECGCDAPMALYFQFELPGAVGELRAGSRLLFFQCPEHTHQRRQEDGRVSAARLQSRGRRVRRDSPVLPGPHLHPGRRAVALCSARPMTSLNGSS